MKNITLIIAIILTSSFGFAQSGAKIDFKAKDNTIDYGTITKNGDSGIRTFEFTNTGNASLIISNVLSTSGFTIQSKPTEPILPGKSGKIVIKYILTLGPIRKTITVESNAVNYDDGIIPLKIKGEVVAD